MTTTRESKENKSLIHIRYKLVELPKQSHTMPPSPYVQEDVLRLVSFLCLILKGLSDNVHTQSSTTLTIQES